MRLDPEALQSHWAAEVRRARAEYDADGWASAVAYLAAEWGYRVVGFFRDEEDEWSALLEKDR